MKKTLIAIAAVIALATPASLPAFAYPAGSAPTLGLSSVSRLLPGGSVSVVVSRVKKNCTIGLSWVEVIDGDTASGLVRATGKTSVLSISTPSTAGVYTLTTNEISPTCSGGSAVTLTKSITVGKLASVVAKLATSSASALITTVSVSGTVKSGSVSVASASVTAKLKKNGVIVKSVTGTTNSSGVFNFSFSGTSYSPGTYTAVVTSAGTTDYIEKSVTTASLTLR